MHKMNCTLAISTTLILALIVITTRSGYADAAATSYQATPTSTETPIIIGGDEADVREMFARLMTDGVFSGPDAVVYVGKLPDTMPASLPMPESAHIVGSVIASRVSMTQIFLNVQQSPDEVVKFYQAALKSPDWTPPPSEDTNLPIVGFVGTPQAQAYFCYQTQKAMLRVVAQGAGTLTHLDLYLTAPADTSACVGAGAGAAPALPYALLPQLQAPDGVTIDPNVGPNIQFGIPAYPSVSLSITLSSGLSATDIAETYNAQIQAAGWTLIGQDSAAKVAWSSWTRKDDKHTWLATFILIATPTSAQYMAQMMIQAG